MTNEELISKYYDGNMQALYDLYEQNVGFIHSVAAAVAKDYKIICVSAIPLKTLFRLAVLRSLKS